MTTDTGKNKARINAEIDADVRTKALDAMRKGETLREFLQAAILGEVERRKAAPGPAPDAPRRLPPGRRPR